MAPKDIHILRLDNPPVNALSQPLRQRIWQGLDAANADPGVAAIVLTGAGRDFSGGADIAEFGTAAAEQAPSLMALLAKIEANPKPVVAAVAGLCLGGGLELALAAHARVAHPAARIALPEVKLGIIPGAGGTQRLPRAIGAARAAQMMTTGAFHPADDFAGTQLFQSLSASPLAAATELAGQLAATRAPLPRLRDLPLTADMVAEARAAVQHPRMRPAEQGVLAALDAGARLDFDAALAEEYRIFKNLHDSAESIALRHAFFAERKAGRLDGPAPDPVEIATLGIVGTGTMGRGIAISALRAGFPVIMIDTNSAARDAARQMIAGTLARDVDKGRMAPAAAEAALVQLHLHEDLQALSDVGLVIEAIYEDMAAKQALFTRLDQICRPDCLLASNTSMLDVNEIARVVANPERVFGLHFFSPAHVMKLVEVVEGARTSRRALAGGLAFCRRIGKIAVIAGVTHGFIGNRMLEAYLDRAFAMVEEGMSPYRIDAALETWGMAMGPFHMLDLAGIDVSHMVRRTRRGMAPTADISALDALLFDSGRLGQKSGQGWYDYTAAQPKGTRSAEVEALLEPHRTTRARPPARYDDDRIVAELVGTLAREGCRIIDEGFARSEGDVDVVYLHGYGFPRHHGGPIHYARTRGLL